MVTGTPLGVPPPVRAGSTDFSLGSFALHSFSLFPTSEDTVRFIPDVYEYACVFGCSYRTSNKTPWSQGGDDISEETDRQDASDNRDDRETDDIETSDDIEDHVDDD